MGIKPSITKTALATIASLLCLYAQAFPKDFNSRRPDDCGYFMCQYEKENIDSVILWHARQSRSLMFGEIHDSVMPGTPPPLEDSLYVISILKGLKAIGYRYLALEVQKDAPLHTHSHDLQLCLKNFRSGKTIRVRDYPFAKPGWIDLMLAAVKIGFQPVFFDPFTAGADRDADMFRSIKEQIFDRDTHAKVLVYVGAGHIRKLETRDGLSRRLSRRQPLGLLLNNFTGGKNYSVYVGYPDDAPAGCDLIISSFVWNAFRQSFQPLQALPCDKADAQ